MKKRNMGPFIAMGGIALVLIIASIFLIVSSSYTARLVLVNDGFFVGEQVHDCLYANDESAVVTSIPAIGASQSDILYEKSGKYFLGDDYTPVSLNFPYVINNASAVMFTSSVDKLITGTFEYVDSYENLYMSGGVTFNADMERAYREDFILVDAGNGIYMNADKLTVGGSLTTSGEIPANSFIRFMENEIGYYYYDNDALIYARIAPVSRTATISLGGYSYTYIEFLEKLGLYTERKAKDKTTPTPTPLSNEEDDEVEPAGERQVFVFGDSDADEGNDNEDNNGDADRQSSATGSGRAEETGDTEETEITDESERDDDEEREMITPDPGERPTRAPKPTRVPSQPEPAEEPLPAEDQGTRVTPTPRPTATPLPTPTLIPALEKTALGGDPVAPAAPAAAAPAAAALPKPAPPAPVRVSTGSAVRPIIFDEWKMPEVTVGEITTGVFTIFLDNFHIDHVKYIDPRSGVMFNVKEADTGKLALAKSVMSGGPVRLSAPFKPETEYTIEIILHYLNEFGEAKEKKVLEYGTVYTTLDRSKLDALDLKAEKGQREPDFFHLLNLHIGIAYENAQLETPRYIESLEFLGRVEIEAINKNDDKDVRKFTLGSSDLRNLRNGVINPDYKSAKVFRSNSEYEYTIRATDRTGGSLLFELADGTKTTEYKGSFKTCSEIPKASFTVRNNRIFDYTVAVRISNPGNAQLKNNVKFRVCDISDPDIEDAVVQTTVQYLNTTVGGTPVFDDEETDTEHEFPAVLLDGLYDPTAVQGAAEQFVEILIKFTDLSAQSIYRLDVYGDCDIYRVDREECESDEDYENKRWSHEIFGSNKFTTASLASLGNLFLDNRIPAENENLEEGTLYMTLSIGERTDDLLVKLLDRIELGLSYNKKDENGEETGEYIKDTDAKISFAIVDRESTDLVDATSVVSHERPENLGEYENEAVRRAQIAYNNIINNTERYNELLGGLEKTAGRDAEAQYDEDGNPLTYSAYKEKFNDANAAISTGNYGEDTPEYEQYQADIAAFEDLVKTLENEANALLRQEAEDEREKVRLVEYRDLLAGRSQGYTTENLFFKTEVEEGQYQVDLNELRRRVSESESASGSAITYKYAKELRIAITGLKTDTMYRIDAEGYATTNMKTDRIARTLLTMSTFRTYKKKAIVSMDAYYAGANFISFFGLKIVDPDGAISEYPVEMVLTDSLGQIMGSRTFKGPDQSFEEVRFGSLTTNEWHYLTFKATVYNKGWTKSSAEINREIFVNDNTETLKVITRESIKANISLLGINDAYDLADEVRVFVDSAKTNIKTLQGRTTDTGNFANIAISNLTFQTKTNGKQYASNGGYLEARYKVEVNLGDDEYNIIEPCIRPIYNKYTRYEVYSNSEYTDLISVVDKNAEVRVSYGSGSATALNRGYWTSNYIRLTRKLTGNTTLYIKAVAINGVTSGDSKGVYPLVGFSFHKFGENAYTANINAVIEDEFGQLSNGSISSYIIRVYEKEGEATSEDLGYTLISERVHAWNEIDNYSGVGDNCNLKMYTREQWDETSGKGTPDLGEKTFYGTANTINTDFGILVNRDKYYRMELWVMINNYSIRLGTSGFTSDRMIHSIENEDDLIDAYCHPSDSYIVMNDITTSKTNIYTTTQFDGVIDFNGHKLTHLANSYLIYSLGAYGELRNIVYEKGNGGNHNYVNMVGLLYYNYGLVNGIQVIYNNGLSDKILKSSSYVDGLIAYQNYPTGIIENFSIELKKDIWFYGSDGVSLAVWLNYGMLRNGYCCATAVEGEEYENGNPTVYANDITVDQNGGYPAIYMLVILDDIKKVITTEVTAKTTYTQNYYTGGLCRINRDGIIENVFTNVDIYARSNDTKNRHKRAASICGRNEGFVRNSFSASRVYYYKEDVTPRVFAAKNGWSPACLNYVNGTYTYGHSTNVYHYDMGLGYGLCKDTDGYSIDSRDISKELLYDHNWYEVLFNESGSTSPNQWDYEMLTRSCFPHVVMSENMPDQPLVKLPALSQSSTEISVLAANVYQQEDTSALATITFYNPNGFLVRDITIDYLKTTIITQWNEGKFYYVRVELSDPVKFYTGYKLTGFTFSNRNGSGRQTGNMHEKTVDVNAEFFGLIYTIQDFRNMSDGLDQNYKLGRDIDFSGYDAKDYALGCRKTNGDLDTVYKTDDNKYCFTGQFEGNNKTLRNIDVGNTGFLFGKVAGPIRNLYIENIHTPSTEAYGAQKSTATYMGVVAVLRLGGSIDNVHVRGAKFENVTQYGGVLLARNFYENQIKNCSVQDAVLVTGMPVENATAASVGGICGHNDLGLQIHNCFVDGITIMAEQAGDVYGVGGLVGYTVQGIEIENVYVVHGRIETNFSNVGGLIGSVQSMNDVNNTSKETLYTGEYFISNFYEDVEIITMANNVGGVIGYTSKVSGTDWAYGVNFGAIVSKSNGVDVKTLNPIVGFYTSATAADYDKGLSGKRFGKHNYIYSSYQMDGEDYITTSRFKADTAQETEEKRESHFKSIDYATLTSSDSYGYKDALIRPILGWRDNFIIDQDDLSKGIMPKLYYTDDVTDIYGNRIELPGQKGFSLQKDEVEVTYAHYLDGYNGGQTDNGDTEFVPEVLIKIDHDEGINITGAGFEGCVWGKDEQQQDMITIQKTSATQTEIRGSLKIFENFGGESIPYAKDKFFLTKIYYDRPVVSGGAIVAGLYEPKVKDVYRDIGLKSRWVTIRNINDWNRFMSQDGSEGAYGDRGFNVKLAPENGVLDFENNVNMAASRVKINHLIGIKGNHVLECGIDLKTMTGTYDPDYSVTIKNLFLYDDELSTGNSNCLIEQATGKIYGINFENCTVSQTYKGAVAGGKVSNKTNIIGVVNGDIDHVSFKNVDILAFKSANIAPIGLAYGVSTNIKIEDVNVVQMRSNGTYISNYSNRAGYVAFLGKFAGVNGVTAKRVYVDAAGSYLGGVVGKQVGGSYLWDISGEDIAVISRSNSSYNGGLVGAAFDRGTMQRVAKLHVDRVFVIGGAYSGGLMGRGYIGGWDGDGYRYVNSTGNSKRLGLSISLGEGNPVIQNDLDNGTTDDSIRSWVKNGMIMAWHNGTNQTTSGAGWDYIGGAVGLGGVWKTDVENTWVFGDDYTGGVVGGYSVVDSKATNVFVSNISEKIEGERLGRYDDPWPSIFYRVGSDDPNATDYYRKLLDDRFGAATGSNYKKLANDVGKTYSWVREYVTAATGKNNDSSANRIDNHDYEQAHANGEFFNWKRGRILALCDDTDDKFWNEVTWGMTSYNGGDVNRFGFDEWDCGRAGKTMSKLSTMMQTSSQDVVKNDAKNDAKGKINKYKTNNAINDGIVSEMISRFNQYNVHYPEEPATLSYIGGISGYNLGMRSVAAENCVIYAPRDFYVGGITGRSTGGHDSGYSTAYGIQSAMVKNCTVIGGSKVGGAVGEIWRDNYQYIEVDDNTYVEARMFGTTAKLAGQTYTSSSVARNNKTSSTGEMAGGIAGRVYMGSGTATEQAQMKYILSAATVVARKNAGGIVGAYDQGFYTNKTDVGWMMLGQVVVWDGDGTTGKLVVKPNVSGKANSYKTGAVHQNSELRYTIGGSKPEDVPVNTKDYSPGVTGKISKVTTLKQSAQQYYNLTNEKEEGYPILRLVTRSDLANGSTYTGIEWPARVEITSAQITAKTYTYAQFLEKRIKYDKLSEGKLPYYTLAGSIQYENTANNIRCANETMFKENPMYLDIPNVQKDSASGINAAGSETDLSGIPKATIYSSGVDTVSIDFSRIDPNYTWSLSLGGVVKSGVVDRRTISFTFDYKDEVTLFVEGADGGTVYTSSGADLANYVSAVGGSYCYITGDGIVRGSGSSSLPTRYGDFVNMYGGKALERDGSIIDIETGAATAANERGTSQGDDRTPAPLAGGEFGGYRIETYATYSVTENLSTGEQAVRDEFLFYTDGKSLQSIRSDEGVKAGNVILWSDLDNTYFASLGTDRKLTVLLDGAFKVPEGISTEGIYQMSNSNDIRVPYCIVRYASGGLCAFNFVTGEILLNLEAPQGTAGGGGDAVSNNSAISFSLAKELINSINSGAVDLNGIVASPVDRGLGAVSAIVDGEYVDGSVLGGEPGGTVTDPGIAVDGLATAVGTEAADGEFIGNIDEALGNPENSEPGEQQEVDENVVDGDLIPEGTEVGTGSSGEAQAGQIEGTNGSDTPTEAGGSGEESAVQTGNTIPGTSGSSGEDAGAYTVEGDLSAPTNGEGNGNTGSLVTLAGSTSTVSADVESSIEELIEDGSLSVEQIVADIGISETEVIKALAEAAQKKYDMIPSISADDAVREAYKAILRGEEGITVKTYEQLELNTRSDNEAIASELGIIDLTGNPAENTVDPSTMQFVPVYNPETGEYELFEMDELLSGSNPEDKSIEERLKKNGMFLNTAHGFSTGESESKTTHDYKGFIAVIIAILLAGGLSGAMIYKKRKEGKG